jgi:hypothetical protein
MGMLEDLGGYLDTQLQTLTLGTNFFYGLMPETVANVVAIYANGGAPPNFTMGSNHLPRLERPQLQSLVRNTSYATGESLAISVYQTLTQITNQSINGTTYLRVEALSMPALLERDANKRAIFTCNFDVVRIPT